MAAYAAASPPIPSIVRECYQTFSALTPTDNTQIGPFSAIYVGVAGDVVLIPRNSTTAVTFKAMPVGIHRIAFQGVNSTGTTATNLVGLA